MAKKLTFGIVGLGGAGRAHAARLGRNPNVGKIYGYDIKKVSGLSGVETVSSLHSLLAKVDAVSICTPDEEHYKDIITCLKAGKHIFCEKPMVANYAETVKLGKLLKKYPKLVFGVHHQMRTAAAFAKAKELIEKGMLGKLFYIEANYWHDMRYRATQFDKWRGRRGQSLLFAHGCHPADLLMHLVGTTPKKHSTYLSKNAFVKYKAKYTSATTLLQFPENIVGKMHVNSSCIYPQVYDLVVLGDKGSYIDGVLYTPDKGFRQVSGFFDGHDNWLDTKMIINKTKLPARLVSFLINLNVRSLSAISNLYIRFMSRITLTFMREADFAFRRFPLTSYNHDLASQNITDNFVDVVLGKTKAVTADFAAASRVIKLCEELEKDGLANFKSG